MTRDGLGRVATGLRFPLADVHDAASFYHYFAVGEGATPITRGRCAGPACSLAGAQGDGDRDASIACPGLCDQPVALYWDGRFVSSRGGAGALAVPHEVTTEEAIYRHVRASNAASLERYRAAGGYGQLLRLLRDELSAERALEALAASGLTGRGGAAFPLAAKWQAVRRAPAGEKYVICNADEGEPGTFKDRPILHLAPHLLLESMAIAGAVVGAETGIIYLRYEYPEAVKTLEGAIREAEDAGLLGERMAGTDRSFRVHVRRGAGSYVCGEETALLNSLEGRRPWPRERPPFPTARGLWGKPTIINNVETLCAAPAILERGPAWYRSLGRDDNAGTKLYSLSGRVRRPGNYELPLGVTARELIESYGGGALPGRRLKAFTLGGISGGLLSAEHLDLPLDYNAPRSLGASIGSGGIIVLDDASCTVDFVRTCLRFYQLESCGRCFPCRIGTTRMSELLDGLTGRAALAADVLAQLQEIGAVMAVASACGLGQSAPLVATGMARAFGEEVDAHARGRTCPIGVCPL